MIFMKFAIKLNVEFYIFWVLFSPLISNLQAHRDPEQLVPAGQAEQGPPFLYIDFPIQFPTRKSKKDLNNCPIKLNDKFND